MYPDPEDKYWVECQDCGDRIKKLSHAQYKDMTFNPYNYIMFCRQCSINLPLDSEFRL